MAQAAEKIIEFPAGGIADFYMEDDEIEALGQLEAEEQFGNKGIANFSVVAERMASYGRHGDDTVAHVETGELVIPKALIEDNPKLRDSIFEHLEELGVEDPERYVVGSGANSINPDTGLPEFFFKKVARAVKKTVKKVSRAVKKVSKSVVKVVKKVAPIVLPIALSFTPLGPIYGAALGSGIGTLIQGGSLKDAFKSALISGATGAVFKGFTGKGTFMENVSNAAANPMGRLSQTASGLGSTLRGGGFTGEGNLFSDFVPTPSAADQLDAVKVTTSPDEYRDLFGVEAKPAAFTPDAGASVVGGGDPAAAQFGGVDPAAGSYNQLATDAATGAYEPRSFLENIQAGEFKEAFLPSGPTPEQIAQIELNAYNNAIAGGASPSLAETAAARAVADATPGVLATLGPSAALGVGALALGGGFDRPDDPPPAEAPPIKQGPEYMVGGLDPRGSTGPTVVASDYQQGYGPRIPYINPFIRPMVRAAEGGEIFPRRVGGIMPDEGTPGKDSVRAMLMPGEFVMTTNAVKGLGDGDNDKGINRMYDMMRGLEAKGRAMA